jgi:hypothetical protein
MFDLVLCNFIILVIRSAKAHKVVCLDENKYSKSSVRSSVRSDSNRVSHLLFQANPTSTCFCENDWTLIIDVPVSMN